MPSRNNWDLVRRAIQSYEAQTYPYKELVILRPAMHSRGPRVQVNDAIGYKVHYYQPGLSIGELRNIACRIAKGSVICHFDDDDWSHPERLARSMEAIDGGASLVGSSLAIYEEPATGRRWKWDGAKLSPKFLLGGTWVYKRELWERRPFPDVTAGEDSRWYWSHGWDGAPGEPVVDLRDETLYRATIHAFNSSPKDTSGTAWEELR